TPGTSRPTVPSSLTSFADCTRNASASGACRPDIPSRLAAVRDSRHYLHHAEFFAGFLCQRSFLVLLLRRVLQLHRGVGHSARRRAAGQAHHVLHLVYGLRKPQRNISRRL
ncbi:hypothetical protein M422DRAFT_37905, partial [Sphaerobolus stellatus SS14]